MSAGTCVCITSSLLFGLVQTCCPALTLFGCSVCVCFEVARFGVFCFNDASRENDSCRGERNAFDASDYDIIDVEYRGSHFAGVPFF